MSYSFEVSGQTKAEAISAAKTKTDAIASEQPIHAADMVAVMACIEGLVASLGDDHGATVLVTASGSCVGKGGSYTAADGLGYVQTAVSAALVPAMPVDSP